MTSFNLKIIALIAMFIDHTGYSFSPVWDTYFMRLIGRVAFPIFAFLIAEGCRKTTDIRKYLLRLGIFALISEIPFDLLLFGRMYEPSLQNVFFTLFIAAAAIWAYETTLRKNLKSYISVFICIPFAVCAYLMKTDFGAYGVMAIFACYIFQVRWQQAAALGIVMFIAYAGSIYFFIATLPAIFLVFIYNGQRGFPMKLAFYFAYPGHLLILAYIVHMIF